MNEKIFSELAESPELLDNNSLSFLKSLVEKYPWFHAGWFLYLKNLKNCNSSEFDTELKKAAIHVPDRKKLHNFLNSKPIVKVESNYTDVSSVSDLNEGSIVTSNFNELIDKFLTTPQSIKKRIIPPFEDELNNEQQELIQQSVSENDEIITETLASIFVKQKKYVKAIDAFKKLSIKYPEKSIYFAARIKDVELLMNF